MVYKIIYMNVIMFLYVTKKTMILSRNKIELYLFHTFFFNRVIPLHTIKFQVHIGKIEVVVAILVQKKIREKYGLTWTLTHPS